jgi:cobalt-zinc-cadmium resistance protein CzcA
MRFDENISITQDIPNPGFIRAQKEEARQEAKLYAINSDISLREIRLGLSQSWYQWLYLNALKKTLLKEDSLMIGFVKAADAKYKSGESNLLEKTIAENRRMQLGQEIRANDMALKQEALKLKQLIGTKEDFIPNEDSLKLIPAPEPDSSKLKKHPVLRYLLQEAALSEAAQKTAAAEKLPEFSGGYFLQSLAGPQEINGQTRRFNSTPQFQGVSLGISVPIFGSKAYKAKQEIYATQKLAREKEAEYLNWQLEKELEQKLEEYDFWQQHLLYFRTTALPNADLIVKNASKSYKNGEIEYVEYLQALRTALDTEKSYLETKNKSNQLILYINYLIEE